MSTLRLVFVCSGNICRSPMAAALAKVEAANRGIDVAVLSCGTLGIVGQPAAQLGQIAMEELGIDLSHHYSQGVQPGLLEVADHIFLMAPRHEQFLMRVIPEHEHKFVRMWEHAPEALEQIDDPVGRDLEAFRECRDLLAICVGRWFETFAV